RVDERDKSVFYVSTQVDPRQRQLYRTPIDSGGPARRLTKENGWHPVWVAPGGGRFADGHSTIMNPAAFTVRDSSGSTVLTIDEGMGNELAAYKRGRVEFRDVRSKDGTMLP